MKLPILFFRRGHVQFLGVNNVICIAVAAHKASRMPEDDMYLPIQVGKKLCPETNLGFQNDDAGDNISRKNSYYSELTALYWIWKNNPAAYKGLVHYRRFFGTKNFAKRHFSRDRFARIAEHDEVAQILRKTDIILPSKRKYYIETIRSHYSHTMDVSHLDITREIIAEIAPGYLPSFDKVMNSTGAHMCNMFIMSSEKTDEYLSWLFPILDRLVERIDSSGYDAFAMRFPGRVSERLLDVWLNTKGYKYTELPVVNTEPVRWGAKITSFLKAKFCNKKYTASF